MDITTDWHTWCVCINRYAWSLKPHMLTHYLVSVCVAAVDVLVVHIAQDGDRRGARGGGGGLEVVAEAEQRALGPGGGAASCHQYKQDLQWEGVRYLGLNINGFIHHNRRGELYQINQLMWKEPMLLEGSITQTLEKYSHLPW